MLAAQKKDETVRLRIDPVHLDKALLRPHHPMRTVEQPATQNRGPALPSPARWSPLCPTTVAKTGPQAGRRRGNTGESQD
ncbi:hypothetical protein AAFF_G00351520 [Aldrovandia affinis]|uniref:Uncharacterized protein n=1 Tax=Aldrovandia affinis TaxID=143900 RepID=A0AAD7WNN9_9TELE|nr:hypothetical protein AAFF_G00351520 [Aldrovandia affinis]